MTDTPETLLEAVRYFSDLDVCHRYLRKIRWPRGVVCPHCESRKVGEISRQRLRCKECRKMIRPEGLVAYNGKMICRSCFGHHQETARFKKKVSTKGYEAHEKRNLMILGGLFVLLGVIVAYSYFFKMRGGSSSVSHPVAPNVAPSAGSQNPASKVDATSGAPQGAAPNAATAPAGRAPTSAGK